VNNFLMAVFLSALMVIVACSMTFMLTGVVVKALAHFGVKAFMVVLP